MEQSDVPKTKIYNTQGTLLYTVKKHKKGNIHQKN